MQDLVLAEAKRLHKLGAAVIWLHTKSKRPVESGWTTGPRADWSYLQETYMKGLNMGVRLGEASKIGDGYLACIDVDIKDPACRTEALTKLAEIIKGAKCPEVRSGAGNGSRHLYCITPMPFKMITIAKVKDKWEICAYSTGRQMVLSPSIHPDTGKQYQWVKPWLKASDLPKMDFSNVAPAEKVTTDKTKKKDTAQVETLSGFELVPVDLEWISLPPKMRAMITKGTGVADRSAMLLPATAALLRAGLTQNEILNVLVDQKNYLGKCAYDHAKTTSPIAAANWLYKYTVKKVIYEQGGDAMFRDGIPEPVPITPEGIKANQEIIDASTADAWAWDLDTTEKGKYRATLKNIDLVLSKTITAPLFVKDLFANRVSYGIDAPWGGKLGEYLEDIDLTLARHWLANGDYSLEAPVNLMHDATALIAHRHRVHPVKDYLEKLVWDGKPRIGTWLKDYCKAVAPEPYLTEVSRKFLCAMVKRVFEPGCQMDYILVLEGNQGAFKSSAARALAGDKWFMDNLPDLKDKDAMLNLQGKWLIELGELANIKRADYSQVKAYLSRRTDTVRPHYGRIQADVPRQSVFIGTVNEGQFLKDPTGNRRYWPVKVGICNAKKLSADRDQLFAEAVHVYKSGTEQLFLSSEANVLALELQDDKRVVDDSSEMKEALIEFIQSSKSDGFNWSDFKSAYLFEGIDVPWSRWEKNRNRSQLAAEILHGLGFEHKKDDDRRFWRGPDLNKKRDIF